MPCVAVAQGMVRQYQETVKANNLGQKFDKFESNIIFRIETKSVRMTGGGPRSSKSEGIPDRNAVTFREESGAPNKKE